MNKNPIEKLLVICGPTASGKSELALRLANDLDAEIVNADSMQVYRGLDIGTAKPSADEQARIRHHLIDIIEPDQQFSAADFVSFADSAIKEIVDRGKRVIVVGGTGLYIRALLHGLVDSPAGSADLRQALHDQAGRFGNGIMLDRLREVDPELASGLHPNNLVRIIRGLEVYDLTGKPLSMYQREHGFASRRYESLQIGIAVNRAELYRRIDARVEQMMADGLLDEVKRLLASGFERDIKSMSSIGYKEAVATLNDEISEEEAARRIKRDTRHYAKRQMTWFKMDPDILWFDYPEKFGNILCHAIDFFEHQEG